MAFIQLLVPIIIFLGFPLGLFLSFVSPEEMKSGKKYFKLLQNILLVLILFFVFDYYLLPLAISIFITVVVFLVLFYWQNKYKSIIIYMLLAVFIYLSSKHPSLFALESSLVFMYGLPAGSLIKCRKKESINIIAKHAIFIVLTILLLLFF